MIDYVNQPIFLVRFVLESKTSPSPKLSSLNLKFAALKIGLTLGPVKEPGTAV